MGREGRGLPLGQFGKHREVAGDQRTPRSHGLEDGNAEAFVERREDDRGAAAIEGAQIGVGDLVAKVDSVTHALRCDPAFERGEGAAIVADNDKAKVGATFPENPHRADQPLIVFARFDMADRQQIGTRQTKALQDVAIIGAVGERGRIDAIVDCRDPGTRLDRQQFIAHRLRHGDDRVGVTQRAFRHDACGQP